MPGPDYWSRTLIAFPIAGAIVTTLFFLLRLYCRHLTRGKFDVGDLFMGLGVLFCYGLTICTVIVAFNGVGHDIWSLPQKTRGRATFIFWLTQKFWPASQFCVKMSIIILLRRILGAVDHMRLITTILIVFTCVWGFAAILGNTFQCWPPQYFWVKSIEGYCVLRQVDVFMTFGSLSMAEDVVLLALPVAVVWRMRITAREKWLLTVLFSIGGLVCVFSLLRLIEFRHYILSNLTSSGTMETVWTLLELNLAIICESITLMRPVLQPCFAAIRRLFSHHAKLIPRPSTYRPHVVHGWPICHQCTMNLLRHRHPKDGKTTGLSTTTRSTGPRSTATHSSRRTWFGTKVTDSRDQPSVNAGAEKAKRDQCVAVGAWAYSQHIENTSLTPETDSSLSIRDINIEVSVEQGTEDRDTVLEAMEGQGNDLEKTLVESRRVNSWDEWG